MTIQPGKYEAKILDYGVVEGKAGPQVKVTFGIKNGPSISYFGGLSEKSQAYTTKNLLIMGATPANIDKVELGPVGSVLNTDKIYELVIEENEYNGKTSPRIKYINDTTIERKGNQAFIKGTGALSVLKGQAELLAQEMGLKPATKTTPTEADVGF